MSEREVRELASKAERSLIAARRLAEAGDFAGATARLDAARELDPHDERVTAARQAVVQLAAVTLPWWSSTSFFTRARPRPAPVGRPWLEMRANFSHTMPWSCGSMPMPVSVTVMAISSSSRRAEMTMRPPGGVNFIELLTML